MSDKKFLNDLLKNKIHWTGDDLKKAKQLKEKGYTKYISGFDCGFWIVTDLGKIFMKDK